MSENSWENKPLLPSVQEIFEAHPDFKKKANEISAILGYNKKFYALGLAELNQEGEHKGHAHSSNIGYWEDYSRFESYIDFLRQIDLHLENKLDAYTGGRDEANYNFEKDHYILYETRRHNTDKKNWDLHLNDAESLYLYETGTRNEGKLELNENPRIGQFNEVQESMRLPQGQITERFYLKHSRGCPPEAFLKACEQYIGFKKELSKIDTSDQRKVKTFFRSKSYMAFTAVADFVDKDQYDYVHLLHGGLVVLNKDVLLDPKEIAEKELAQSENDRLEKMYGRYLEQAASTVARGSDEDLQQFKSYLQSL